MLVRMVACTLALACCALSHHGLAAERVPAAEAARARGKQLYEKYAFDDAVREFSAAYALSSDPELLYELGMAHAASGNSVEAATSLRRYLVEGAATIGPERRRSVQGTIEDLQLIIATLVIQARPAAARVTLDGRELDAAVRGMPVEVRAGTHVVAATLEGHRAAEQVVSVRGKAQEVVTLHLEPAPSPIPNAQLIVDCPLPGVAVSLDGTWAATTPVPAPLLVKAGAHRLRLARSGYSASESELRVEAGKVARVACRLEPTEPLRSPGRIQLEVSEPNALILVDGRPSTADARVPEGLHSVEVKHYGFAPWKRDLFANADTVIKVGVELVPSPAYLRDYESRAGVQRTWSYVLGGSGVAALGVAIGLGVWNAGRNADWEDKRSALEADYASGDFDSADLERRRDDANALRDSIDNVDLVTTGFAVAGGLLTGAGAVLFLWGEEPDRYRGLSGRVQVTGDRVSATLAW